MDDRFFTLVPQWARERCGDNLYAVTDLCRLQWLQQTLAEGRASRAIWIDADVLVFAPDSFRLPIGTGHAFAKELFLKVGNDGSAVPVHGINNAVMVFERGDATLAAYLDACTDLLRTLPSGPVPRTALGPQLLQRLAEDRGSALIDGVGLFTLALMREVARGGSEFTRAYLQHSPTPPAAANLCHFLRNATPPLHRAGFDALYLSALEQLLATKGAVLNGSIRPR